MYKDLSFTQWSDLVWTEICAARAKFPAPQTRNNFAALVEEVGEVAKALMDEPNSKHCFEEIIQIACLCYRLASEGDMAYGREEFSKEQL